MGVSYLIPIFLFHPLVVRYLFSMVKEIDLVTIENGVCAFHREENHEG